MHKHIENFSWEFTIFFLIFQAQAIENIFVSQLLK